MRRRGEEEMGRQITIFAVFTLILTNLVCQQNSTNETKINNAKPTQTAITEPTLPANKNYDGKGVVTKINLELVSVELNHEKIEGLMPAMQMEFFVKEKKELEKLKVGDKVAFVIEYKDGQEKIISIKKIQ